MLRYVYLLIGCQYIYFTRHIQAKSHFSSTPQKHHFHGVGVDAALLEENYMEEADAEEDMVRPATCS
jgi:hypothetical protein